jgi:hypothetical protein
LSWISGEALPLPRVFRQRGMHEVGMLATHPGAYWDKFLQRLAIGGS